MKSDSLQEKMQEMQERVALLERLTANVPVMLYQLLRLPDGSISFAYASQGCCDICNLEPQAIRENAALFLDRIHPEDRASFDESLVCSGATLELMHWEGRFILSSGQVKWLLVKANPERCPTEGILWDGFLTDITVRKQAEVALSESELQLRLALNASEMGTWDWNLDTNVITWSERTEAIFSYAKGTFPGTYEGFIDRIHPDDREMVMQACTRSLEEKIPCSLEYRLLLPDGTVRWVAKKGDFLFDEMGQPRRLSGVTMDITERKMAEEKLRKSEANLLVAQRIAHVGSWEFNVGEQKLSWSKEKFRIFGLDSSQPEPTYAQLIELIHPDDQPMFQQTVGRALTEGTSYEIVFRIKRPSGEIRHIETRGEAVFNSAGQVVQLFGTVVDTTERKLAEEETLKILQRERELSEAKSRFIAMTSHDLRTPLTTIQSSVDLLRHRSEKLSSERQQVHLDRICSGVEQMTRMVQDVLILSEAEAGKLQFAPTQVDLVQLCHSLIADLQVADSNEHSFVFTPSGECGAERLGLDEKLARYILSNLLTNAMKYSPKGSTVQFDLICHPNQVVFRIQDQGIGIPPEHIPRLFESFYRASNVGAIQGTGLGLAIVKQCVDLHGGKMAVNSIVGEGTTFTVMLPLTQETPAKASI
ncbi:MAG TPA: PAS domain-containing protein [Waterburya sp.]